MIPLTNQKVYKVLDKQNKQKDAFRNANPQFKMDNSNIASTVSEIEYFENLYSNMECGLYEYSEKEFHFKRADRYTFKDIFCDNFENYVTDNPTMPIREVVLEEVSKMTSCQDPSLRTCHL